MSGNVIDVYAPDEDAEYAALIARLESQPPPGDGTELDFGKIAGNAEKRSAKAVILYQTCCRKWSVSRIADRLGISVRAVSRLLAEALAEAIPFGDIELVRQFELSKLDAIEQECDGQFKRSCENEETVRETMDKDGEVRELKTTKGQSGNPAYLRALVEIAKLRARLQGLEKPVKKEVDKTTRRIDIKVVEIKSREDAEKAKAAGLLE
jgi:hypothetical protein